MKKIELPYQVLSEAHLVKRLGEKTLTLCSSGRFHDETGKIVGAIKILPKNVLQTNPITPQLPLGGLPLIGTGLQAVSIATNVLGIAYLKRSLNKGLSRVNYALERQSRNIGEIKQYSQAIYANTNQILENTETIKDGLTQIQQNCLHLEQKLEDANGLLQTMHKEQRAYYKSFIFAALDEIERARGMVNSENIQIRLHQAHTHITRAVSLYKELQDNRDFHYLLFISILIHFKILILIGESSAANSYLDCQINSYQNELDTKLSSIDLDALEQRLECIQTIGKLNALKASIEKKFEPTINEKKSPLLQNVGDFLSKKQFDMHQGKQKKQYNKLIEFNRTRLNQSFCEVLQLEREIVHLPDSDVKRRIIDIITKRKHQQNVLREHDPLLASISQADNVTQPLIDLVDINNLCYYIMSLQSLRDIFHQVQSLGLDFSELEEYISNLTENSTETQYVLLPIKEHAQ